ncbi:MAG: exodeoxyribonuclease VII large subunit [Acidobacteriota bacterium]
MDELIVFSVSEVTSHLKQVIESQIEPLYVRGEISNYTRHPSGHIYFSLKDANATLRCTFFRGSNIYLDFEPEEGMEVICYGKLTIYEKGSTYNLNVYSMQLAGKGDLARQFELLKKKLQMGNYSGPDSHRCVIPLSTYVAQYGEQRLHNVVLKISSPEKMKPALDRFKQVMGVKAGFSPEDTKALHIWDTVESSKYLVNFTVGIKLFLGIIGVLTLLVGGTGVANIMYAVVKEKTKEIGIMMAIGAKPKWITTPFLLQSLFYTFLGGFFGLVISAIIVFLLSFIPTEGSMALEFLGKPTLSLPIGIFTAFVLGFVGFLAGHFPAKRASLINPAETLRYE